MKSKSVHREKYMKMAQTVGLDKAVSALHNYIGTLEPKVFDGGFKPDRFEELQLLRELSRELWMMRLNESKNG
ncbi:MAG: hypothetical protein AB7F43_05875 [Bacteriovoracia bacterium]